MTQDSDDRDEESSCDTDDGGSTDRSPQPWWDDPDLQRQRLAVQVELILRAIPGAAVYPPGQPREMQYLYVEGRVLVRDSDLARVQAVVPGRVVDALVNGVTAYSPDDMTTLEALDAVDNALGVGVATPDHIYFVAPTSLCPATEPLPTGPISPNPAPVPADSGDGGGSFVAVVDTGFIPALDNAQQFWLEGVIGDEEIFDPNDIAPYVGHGTFVAGVVRCIAPNAEVFVHGHLARGGAVVESCLLPDLNAALDQMPDVISMSAGCTTRGNLPPLSLEVFWESRLRHCKGTVLVVAAGNNGSRRPFWPAAYEWTVSVGALGRDGARAPWSDFGSWVDVYALGTDIVNAYPNGTYYYKEPPNIGKVATFTDGMAVWSGTSFATPLVAGMIAARRSRTGQSGRQAADSLLRIARANATPGVGAIADPSMTFDADPAGP